jgi:hypothetical protein
MDTLGQSEHECNKCERQPQMDLAQRIRLFAMEIRALRL